MSSQNMMIISEVLDEQKSEDDLETFVKEVDLEELLSALTFSLSSNTKFMHKLLGVSGRKTSLGNIRIAIMTCALRHLMREEQIIVENGLAAKIAQSLQAELGPLAKPLPINDMIQLLKICRAEIRDNKEKLSPHWLEFLATLLASVHEREVVVLDDEDPDFASEDHLTGPEYRARFINFLCETRWNPKSATSLCKMIREVATEAPLTTQEMEIVDKLRQSLKKLNQEEVPPLVYQMLSLQHQGSSSMKLIRLLSEYFNKKITKSVSSNGISGQGDALEFAMQSEGTVICHIFNVVQMGHTIAKDVLKILRAGSQAPDVVLNHFILFLALSLTSVKHLKQQLLDSMKSTLSKHIVMELRLSKDAWLRNAVRETSNPLDVITELIDQTKQFGGWDLVSGGVIDLAFTLLDLSPGFGKPDLKLKKIWDIGCLLLSKVVSADSKAIKGITDTLASKIISFQALQQHTNCLRIIVKDSFSLFMENQNLLNPLVEQICSLGTNGAKRLIFAILPVIKYNRYLRDSTILTLRKALFARPLDTKLIGIQGVMQLIQVFKIKSSLQVTQMSQSSSSSMSQIVSDVYKGVSTPNESLCNELMGVLRRGLTQSPQVRLQIYCGLNDILGKNPELCQSVLDMLLDHVSKHGWIRRERENNEDEDIGGIIDLEKIIFEETDQISVTDPVGWLIHCIQLIINKAEQLYGKNDSFDFEDIDLSSRDKLNDLLSIWIKKYEEADLLDLNFEKNADFSHNTVNSIKVDTTKNIYEALMEFVVSRGLKDSEKNVKSLILLFERYEEVSSLTKGTVPIKKEKKPKKGDADNSQGVGKKGNLVAKSPTMKAPGCAMSVKALASMQNLIFVESELECNDNLKPLKDHTGLKLFTLKSIKEKINQIDASMSKAGSDDSSGSDTLVKQLAKIAEILVQKVLSDANTNDSVDESEILIHSSECIYSLLEIVTYFFPKKLQSFLAQATRCFDEQNAKEPYIAMMKICQSFIEKLLVSLENLVESSAQQCEKVIAFIFRTLLLTSKTFISEFKECDDTAEELLKWNEKVMVKFSGHHRTSLKPFLEFFLFSCDSVKTNPMLPVNLAREVHSKIGDLNSASTLQDIPKRFPFINEESATLILSVICVNLEQKIDSADFVIARMKQIINCHSYGYLDCSSDTNLKESEYAVCFQLCRVINALTELTSTGFDIDAMVEYVTRLLTKLYSTLGILAKYFGLRARTSVQAVVEANFKQLVEVVGKSLTNKTYELISNIEVKHQLRENVNSRTKKKKTDSASNAKEGRAIPNLIFKIENFEKDVIGVGSKCKLDFLQGTKMTSNRDFRLKTDSLRDEREPEENGGDENEEAMETDEDENEDPNADSSVSEANQSSSQVSNMSSQKSSVSSSSSAMPPPGKKLKVRMSFPKNKNAI